MRRAENASRGFARARACTRGRHVRAWMCTPIHAEMCVCKRATPRNARVAPMAVNATRLERSRLRNAVPEPNSEAASSLGYCAQKQERRVDGGGRRERGSAGNGPHREPPQGPLLSRMRNEMSKRAVSEIRSTVQPVGVGCRRHPLFSSIWV